MRDSVHIVYPGSQAFMRVAEVLQGRLHTRKHKSEREIARVTGLSRNTVSKWLHGEVDGPPKYRRGEQPNKLTVFHEALKQALKADARRPAPQA